MPIPFILGGAAALAGGYGVKKGLDAKEDMDKAKRTNERARELAASTERRIDNTRESTNNSLQDLGRTKISILAGSLNEFVENFSRIKNVNITDSVGLEELRGFNPNSKEFLDMKEAGFKASELATGGLGGIAAGTLTAAGAYGAVGLLATASTGTAIAGLTGAAATNATLAWLGGGALAAGGFGMAGGALVLGGIVAGPALAIGGVFMAEKAEKALNDARSNYDQARRFEQEGENICSTLRAIKDRAVQIEYLLNDLDEYLSNYVSRMSSIISARGTNWNDYRPDDKKYIGIAAQLAKTTKTVIDTSLLKEDGKLNDSASRKSVEAGRKVLANI